MWVRVRFIWVGLLGLNELGLEGLYELGLLGLCELGLLGFYVIRVERTILINKFILNQSYLPNYAKPPNNRYSNSKIPNNSYSNSKIPNNSYSNSKIP